MSMIEKQIEEWEKTRRRSFLTFANAGNEQLDEAYQVISRLVDEATKMTKYLSEKIAASNLNGGWHVVSDGDLPRKNEYILLSFSNFSSYLIGRYEENEEGGAFYCGDEDESLVSQDLYVNAWMKLPEPYKKGRIEQ